MRKINSIIMYAPKRTIFETAANLGEETEHPARDIPRAVLLSLLIQGVVCYLIEYFAAGYFLHNNYTLTDAAASSAPAAD